jgi:hypothetical protein
VQQINLLGVIHYNPQMSVHPYLPSKLAITLKKKFLSELLDFCFAEGRLNSVAAVILSGDPAELKFFSWPTRALWRLG